MNMTYIASSGNTYNIMTRRILTRDANYHSWKYDPQAVALTYGERISWFKRDALEYKTELIIRGNITQRRAILTALHDDFEKDVRTKKTGRIMFGEWYCDCFITESATEPDKDVTGWTSNEIKIYVPSGYWVKESVYSLTSDAVSDAEYLDYTYDYAYDYSPNTHNLQSISTDSPFESHFRMDIYGPVVNPRIAINGYPYIVYATIASGQTLTIDSKAKTVTCGSANLFDSRNKSQSVFAEIPSGDLTISWGAFDFDLTLYEERSEPKW